MRVLRVVLIVPFSMAQQFGSYAPPANQYYYPGPLAPGMGMPAPGMGMTPGFGGPFAGAPLPQYGYASSGAPPATYMQYPTTAYVPASPVGYGYQPVVGGHPHVRFFPSML
jgi:hypothetical protein